MEYLNEILNQKYPFVAFPLSLPENGCEPVISAATMRHHYEYFKNYIDELNIILSKFEEYQSYSLFDLLTKHDELDKDVRARVLELASGIFNHEFIFYLLAPPLEMEPEGKLLDAVNKDFGSYEGLKEKMKEAAMESVGARYSALILDELKNLKVMTIEKESTPYVFSLKPLFLIDVFEHAYYLDRAEDVKKYLELQFKCVDWKKIEKIYESYIS